MKNVKETKPKTLIVYEDNVPDLEVTAQALFKLAEAADVPVKARSASSVTVDEILAAKFFVFGENNAGAPVYSELLRFFKGMNLAGRKAAFFFTRGAKGAEGLKTSLKETDISFSVPDLNTGSDSAALASWLRAAMDF